MGACVKKKFSCFVGVENQFLSPSFPSQREEEKKGNGSGKSSGVDDLDLVLVEKIITFLPFFRNFGKAGKERMKKEGNRECVKQSGGK